MEDNKRGGNGRRTEGRREYGSRDASQKRPRISRSSSRSFGEGTERRNFGERSERRSFGERSERRTFGDRPQSDRPRRSFSEGGERRPFGERPERRTFGDRSERRPFGERSERRTFGDRPQSDRPRRSFSEGGERRSFGERSERRSFGDRTERRPFGERSERRTFGDRKPAGPRFNSGRKSFNKKDLNYFRDEEQSGISRMINRRPQLDAEYNSDNDMVMAPIKEEIRLNKYIANSGVCSRREADNLILAGVVTVNGEVVTELGTKVNINTDDIRFNGERLKGEAKIYIVMNKPKGYVTTASDPHADKTVMDLMKGCPSRVFPVGRLDKNTTGVLMFTHDGEIAEKLTHPSYDKKKIYQVSLDSKLKQDVFE